MHGIVDLGELGLAEGADISPFLAAAWEQLPRGGTIRVPPGCFEALSPVEFSGRPLRLVGAAIGDGRNGSQITFRTGEKHGLEVSRARGLHIADLTLRGHDMRPGSFLLSLSDRCAYVTIERCIIERGANGLWVRRVNRLRIHAATLRDFTDQQSVLLNGVGDDGRNHSVEFVCSTICSNNAGTDNIVQDGPGASTKLIGCYVGQGRHGFWQRNTTGSASSPNFLYITAGGFEGGAGDCVRLECGQKAFLGGGAYLSSRGDGDGLALRGSFSSCVVSGSYIRGNGRHGIYHDAGALTVGSSMIVNNGRSGRRSLARPAIGTQAHRGGTLVPHEAARHWDPGDRVRIGSDRGGGWEAIVVPVFPVSVLDRGPGFFTPHAVPEGVAVVRVGQGIRSTRDAGRGVVNGNLIGHEEGGLNNQEHDVLSDNGRLLTDQAAAQTVLTLVGGVLLPQFLHDGVWQAVHAIVARVGPEAEPDAGPEPAPGRAVRVRLLVHGAGGAAVGRELAVVADPTRHCLLDMPLLDARQVPLRVSVRVEPPELRDEVSLDMLLRKVSG